MHLVTGEVAPLAPLLIPVGEILVWAVALAFCLLAVYIAKAFFGATNSAVGWIPYFGKIVTHSLTSIEQKIVSFLSGAANSADAKMGAAFHELARVVDWLGHEIAAHANLLATLAQLVVGQSLVGEVRIAINAVRALVDGVGHTASIAIRRIEALEKGIVHTAISATLPRVGRLEREIGHVIEHDIPSLRSAERALEDGALNTFKWIKAHPLSLASTAFAGAVAIALARLGAGWTRCSNWNKIGKHVCGLPTSLIEDLLGLSLALLAVIDPVAIAEAALAVEDAAHGIITKMAELNPEGS